MSSNRFFSRLCVFTSLLAFGFTATASYGQTSALSVPRVLGPVSESQFATLKKNVLPLAQARFDQGAVPDSTPTGHMLVMLKRSDAQQKALDELVAAQQDPKSASYHKWLTPAQFGAQFGVADADVQAVTSYLAAQGFAVGRVFKSKMAVEFSGTTGQVRSAFRTQIHSYVANGQSFHANASAPQIPAALAPVVKGVTLNNYKAVQHASQKMVLDRKTGRAHPLYTDVTNFAVALSPGDLGVIYDIPAAATGSGVTVGVIGDSNINLAIPANYRTLFQLPASAPTVIVDGTDPGINTDADIAYGQIELLAATAPQAKVNFYTAATTDLDTGLDFAAIRAVDDNESQVLVFGFEGCEANLGPSINFLFGELWQQAAAQGASVITGSGSGGAAGCDASANGTAPETVATNGLAVNGYASTPYDTAVAPSDFFYGATGSINLNDPNSPFYTYWSLTNGGAAGFTSAKKYIPEQPSNSSNQATNQLPVTPSVVVAAGGGISTLGQTADDGTQSPYLQPSYQAGVAGGISTTARVLPDVSFFGSNYTNGSDYILCIDAADCVDGSPDSVQYTAGGDSSLAASAFAGVAALVIQAHGAQGNLNNGLYATHAAAPAAFHDITAGTNMVACAAGSPDCVNGFTSGYSAGAGYDAASGLGSVDVAQLISNWHSGSGTGTATVTVSLTQAGQPVSSFLHNAPVQLNLTATGSAGTPTGDVAITVPSNGKANSSIIRLTLDNTGSAVFPGIAGLLPGGTYSLVARYAGDVSYAPAVASIPVTVTAVPSKLIIETSGAGPLPIYNGQSLPYGTSVHFTFSVQDAAANSNDPYSATGYVNLTDGGKQLAVLPLDSEGFASFSSSQLAAGSHIFSGAYSGDSTFSASSLTGPAPSVVIAGVPTTTTLVSTDASPSVPNNTVTLVATVTPNQACNPLAPCPTGAAPGGKVRFKKGSTILGTVTLGPGVNTGASPSSTAVLTLPRNTLAGSSSNSITATYIPNGTGDYLASTSAPLVITVGAGSGALNTNISLSTTPANATNFVNTSDLIFVATVSNTIGRRATPTGTVAFYSNGTVIGSAPLDLVGIAAIAVPKNNGLLALPLGQSSIIAQYGGDSTHAPSSVAYTINVYSQNSTPDFAMQNNLISQVITAASRSAKFTLQFTSMNNFSQLGIPIALSYTTPAGITCTSSPAAPNFRKTLYATVTTTCKAAAGVTVGQLAMPAPGHPRGWWMAEGGTALAFIFLFGMPGRRRKWQSLVGSLALMVVAFGMTGCGASVANGPQQQYYDSLLNGAAKPAASGALPRGTYTVIVTGTANVLANSQSSTTVSVVHNLPLKIVVQ
jgi:trimeric autotransporter adhesin